MVRPPATNKKKKTIAKSIKVVPLAPKPSSSSTTSGSIQSASSAHTSKDDSSSPRLDTIDPRTGPSQPELKSIVLGVVNELEEEEDMNDLRVGFMKRHHKRLYEVIDIAPPPAKKACSERAQEEPAGRALLVTMPQPDVVGPSTVVVAQPDVVGLSSAPTAEKEAC